MPISGLAHCHKEQILSFVFSKVTLVPVCKIKWGRTTRITPSREYKANENKTSRFYRTKITLSKAELPRKVLKDNTV